MDNSEQYRHECEARFWLSETGGNPALVDALMERITKKRGKAAAERLREGMRAEFVKQRGQK